MFGVVKALQLKLLKVLQFRYLGNKKMTRARAVWHEKNKDGVDKAFEQSVPTYWIVSRKLHWPNHLNVKRSFRNREDVTEDWFRFDLIKIKVTGQ